MTIRIVCLWDCVYINMRECDLYCTESSIVSRGGGKKNGSCRIASQTLFKLFSGSDIGMPRFVVKSLRRMNGTIFIWIFAKFGSKRSKLYAFNQDETSLNSLWVLFVDKSNRLNQSNQSMNQSINSINSWGNGKNNGKII
jgi:hypothetical protein